MCVCVCNTLERAHTPAVTQITTNVELWELSARYHLSDTDPVSQDKVSHVCASQLLLMYDHNCCLQGVTELQRAQRTSRQQQGWEKNAKTIEQVVNLTVHYCTGMFDGPDTPTYTHTTKLMPQY